MKDCKCPNCGASIDVDESKDVSTCKYCNTPFVTEKALKNNATTNNNNAQVINYYYGSQDNNKQSTGNLRVPQTPRPKLNVFLAVILYMFYIVPGIIYTSYVKSAQKEWDDKYTY